MRSHWIRRPPPSRVCRRQSSLAAPAPRPRGPPTRSLQWKSLTTLFYSTVMATACAADAHIKQTRRHDWSEKIAQLEQELGKDLPLLIQEEATEAATHESEQWHRSVNRLNNGWIDGDQPADFKDIFRPLATDPNNVCLTAGYSPRSITVSPRSIYADQAYTVLDARPRASAWTPKKCLNVELTVAHMVTGLMVHLYDTPSRDGLGVGLENAREMKQYKDNLRALKRTLWTVRELKDPHDVEGMSAMRYPQYDSPSPGSRLWAQDLNNSLRKILKRHSRRKLTDEQAITRIAYNLMVSRQAPDNSTFTLLISYFSANKYHTTANIIVNALDSSNIQEDEMSVNAVLTHYTRSHDHKAFVKYAERMKGLRGGLTTTQPQVRVSPGNEYLRVSKSGGHVFRCVVEDQTIFNSLINGYLTFGDYTSAMDTYKKMTEKGFSAHPRILTKFIWFFGDGQMRRHRLKQSISMDHAWERGLATWNILKKLRDEHWLDDSIWPSAYKTMLMLCKSCGRQEDYDRIQQEGEAECALKDRRLQKSAGTWFDSTERQRRSVRRKLNEFENVLVRIDDDIRKATARVLASKLFLAGQPISKIREAFDLASAGPEFRAWWEERQPDDQQVALASSREITEELALPETASLPVALPAKLAKPGNPLVQHAVVEDIHPENDSHAGSTEPIRRPRRLFGVDSVEVEPRFPQSMPTHFEDRRWSDVERATA
ncbi:hypothetical protein FH972_024708 [Carpinus fangiana]|uniref:Uncharacterized protein n=1 Tax=Carpinus fangiana TaxID=176857 RepID=A0A5N6KZN7_9ROSI|nr:hypothetical protein FH972_024708 [Carpinus fangiana]